MKTESPESAEQFDVEALYQAALEDHAEYKDFPPEQIKGLIAGIAHEIAHLEEVGEREKARIEMPAEVVRNIGAVWAFSGVGTYERPVKDEKERPVYQSPSWLRWADRLNLNHMAMLALTVAEVRSREEFDAGSFSPDTHEGNRNIKELVGRFGPPIIYNGTESENDVLAEVLASPDKIIPRDRTLEAIVPGSKVTIIRGTAERPIVNTLDVVKTFHLPFDFGENQELAIVAPAPQLARIMRMVKNHRPFPEHTKVRLFPVPTLREGKKEYAKMEILGILSYALLKKVDGKAVADAESYPYAVNE
ncbi:MAG: hypothetical protein A2946_03970 [Candidatus Liptonbacteria bacterium RIFCSPLOWO2_01_FULL_53_13]|uniref:Uncharacterized protein n=1 Tax=Candidatus Liptonbacteria bacterium RIFCSPLOWO2_01_FULL_53_13 TaxID=1798651 RepID=A0A1G2CK53_9BACT|nr:MAG: hypothetical protein A2946_03970 [Candidatus Liptonbacteria bacterium RIFCSPLOWO2_01_FULL_53_13]